MTNNKYTGEVILEIDGEPHRLVYGWREIAEIQSALGLDILKTIFNTDPVSLATILAIGLKKHHPAMTAEKIMDYDAGVLPLYVVKSKIDEALAIAYFGPDGLPTKAEAEPAPAGESPGAEAKKKTP